MLGVTKAVTGGMIRDIIVNEIPLVLKETIYATAAFITGLEFFGAHYVGIPRDVGLLLAVVAGFAVPALAIRYNWSLPPPRVRR